MCELPAAIHSIFSHRRLFRGVSPLPRSTNPFHVLHFSSSFPKDLYTVESVYIRTNKERQNIQIIEQLLSFPLNFVYSSRNEEKWRFLSNGSRIFSAVKSRKFFTASNCVELRPRCASNRRTIHHDIFLLISSHFHHFLKIFNNWNYTSTCHLDSPLHTESIRLRLTQVEHSIYLNTLYLRCNL